MYICYCNMISEDEIKQVIVDNNIHSIEELLLITVAGSCCGGCIPELIKLVEDHHD